MPGIKRSLTKRIADRQEIANLRLRGVTIVAIAKRLGVAPMTVKRELRRLEAEWRVEAAETVEQAKAVQLKRLEHVYAEAWSAWEDTNDPRYLQVALSGLEKVMRLLGLEAPQKIAHTNPDGTALTKEHRDAVVAAALAGLAASACA